MFPSSTKREISHFHVVVVQRRLRNVQKSVMHVQSCCFANLSLLVFYRSCYRCVSSLINSVDVKEPTHYSLRVADVVPGMVVYLKFTLTKGVSSLIPSLTVNRTISSLARSSPTIVVNYPLKPWGEWMIRYLQVAIYDHLPRDHHCAFQFNATDSRRSHLIYKANPLCDGKCSERR